MGEMGTFIYLFFSFNGELESEIIQIILQVGLSQLRVPLIANLLTKDHLTFLTIRFISIWTTFNSVYLCFI